MDKLELGMWIFGACGIGSGITVAIQKLVERVTKSKIEKKIEVIDSEKAELEKERMRLEHLEEEIRISNENEDRCGKKFTELQGVVDGLREKVTDVSSQISTLRMKHLETEESLTVANKKLGRYRTLIKNIVIFSKKHCPKSIDEFVLQYNCLELEEEINELTKNDDGSNV